MVTLLRGSLVVVVGALLLTLPMMSGAAILRFHNQTYTCYKVDCTASNPNGSPACQNPAHTVDISYVIENATNTAKSAKYTDADISVNRAVEVCVPSNVSLKQVYDVTSPFNSHVCYNVPIAQRFDPNQLMTNSTVFNQETGAARATQTICFPAVTQDCPGGVCPPIPGTKLP